MNNQVVVYQTDDANLFLHQLLADANPLRHSPNPAVADDWLIPANAYLDAPPETQVNEIAQRTPDKTGWVIVPDFRGTQYWLADGTHSVITGVNILVPTSASLTPIAPPLTPAQEKDQFTKLIQAYIDAPAIEWGYYNANSAITYVGDTYAQFNADGVAIRNFRSKCWQVANSMYAQYLAGTITKPTPAQVIAAMPTVPTQPTP